MPTKASNDLRILQSIRRLLSVDISKLRRQWKLFFAIQKHFSRISCLTHCSNKHYKWIGCVMFSSYCINEFSLVWFQTLYIHIDRYWNSGSRADKSSHCSTLFQPEAITSQWDRHIRDWIRNIMYGTNNSLANFLLWTTWDVFNFMWNLSEWNCFWVDNSLKWGAWESTTKLWNVWSWE